MLGRYQWDGEMSNLSDKEIAERARYFWESDLRTAQNSKLLSLPVTKLDGRVPSQGTTLVDKPCFLPKEWQ
jgi:hypothetical protein